MTYAEIMTLASALLNDQARENYTNVVMLPYLNIARMELEEIFELNSIPTTNETSTILTVPIGGEAIGFAGTPALPTDLVEIQQLWEADENSEDFVPVTKKSYLGSYNGERSFFGVWAWMSQEIRLPGLIIARDVKLDYIASLFTLLTIGDVSAENNIINTSTYFHYRLAGLCSEFIDENTTRAAALNGNAGVALERSLGISVKGKQAIFTRRRPFRAAFKRRGIIA